MTDLTYRHHRVLRSDRSTAEEVSNASSKSSPSSVSAERVKTIFQISLLIECQTTPLISPFLFAATIKTFILKKKRWKHLLSTDILRYQNDFHVVTRSTEHVGEIIEYFPRNKQNTHIMV